MTGLRGGDPAAAPAPSVENALDTAMIARTLGHAGEMSRGVCKVTIGRPDVLGHAYPDPAAGVDIQRDDSGNPIVEGHGVDSGPGHGGLGFGKR